MPFIRYTFLEIDECSLSLDDCHPNSTCTNIGGSFLCTCDGEFAGNETLCQGNDHDNNISVPFSISHYLQRNTP
jgi:hypothetical protein